MLVDWLTDKHFLPQNFKASVAKKNRKQKMWQSTAIYRPIPHHHPLYLAIFSPPSEAQWYTYCIFFRFMMICLFWKIYSICEINGTWRFWSTFSITSLLRQSTHIWQCHLGIHWPGTHWANFSLLIVLNCECTLKTQLWIFLAHFRERFLAVQSAM